MLVCLLVLTLTSCWQPASSALRLPLMAAEGAAGEVDVEEQEEQAARDDAGNLRDYM